MNTRNYKVILTVAAMLFGFGAFASTSVVYATSTSNTTTTVSCDPNTKTGLVNVAFNPSAGTATVKNTALCAKNVHLATYNVFDKYVRTQTRFDDDTKVLQPGETATFSVNRPTCAYQIDLGAGYSYASNPNYPGNTLLAWRVYAPEMESWVTNVDTSTGRQFCGQGTPALSIVKNAPANVQRGSNVEFTFVVKNTGTATATAIYLSDTINGALSYIPTQSSSQCKLQAGTQNDIECNVASLGAGKEITLKAVFKVENSFTCNSDIVNRAAVRATSVSQVLSNETKTRVQCPTNTCTDPNPSRDLRGSLVNTSGGRVVNLSTVCSYEVGIATYKMYDRNIDNQTLFDYATSTIAPGETKTFDLRAPSCAYQIDLFHGRLITSFAGGVRYGNRLLAAEQRVTNNNFCSPDLPAIPNPTVTTTCENNAPKFRVSWTAASRGAQGYHVDIDTDSNWGNGGYFKDIASGSTLSATGPDSSYVGFDGVTGSLTALVGGQTYRARIYYPQTQEHSGTVTFTAPSNCTPVSTPKVTIVADKVVCDSEADLPNWSASSVNITEATARNYVANSNGKCRLVSGWDFQWGYGRKTDGSQGGVAGTAGDYVGPVTTGTGYNQWKMLGTTNSSGRTQKTIDINGSERIWIREVLKSGYVPFSVGTTIPATANQNNVSAEMWCHTDVLNYDNFDWVMPLNAGQTYHCVAFNALKETVTPPTLNATCAASASSVTVGNPVTWTATVTGTATGTRTYSWTGTDSLSGTTNPITKIYTTTGTKTATVTVRVGNLERTAQCNVNITPVVTNNFNITCAADRATANIGENVLFTSAVTNAPGTVTYAWSGAENATGTASTLTKSFATTGNKILVITATSNGQTRTAQCSVNITETTNNNWSVACDASPTRVRTGEVVTWTSSATNAPGSVSYSWSGDESLSGNTSTITKSYGNEGTKNGTVTATSNGQTRTAQCSVVVRNETTVTTGTFDATCRANPTNPKIGDLVTFTVDATGGTVRPYTFAWSGDESLSGTTTGQFNATFTKIFNSNGIKNVNVTVTSAPTETKTVRCPVTIGTGITVTETATPTIAGVFLTQVPYTGLNDTIAIAALVAALLGITGFAGYTLIKRRYAHAVASSAAVEAQQSAVAAQRAYTEYFMNTLESHARAQGASVSADVTGAVMKASNGNIDWAKAALTQIIAVTPDNGGWKLVTLDSAKQVYPYIAA